MEHGVDARHAAVRRRESDPPALAPQPRDVLDAVRVHREFHFALLARRGRPRQARDAGQDAGRRLAEARDVADAVRLHVRAPRQEAAVHGQRVRPVARVEPRREPRLAPARRSVARSDAAVRAGAQLAAQRRAGAAPGGLRSVGFPLDRLQRQREQRRFGRALRARPSRLHRDGVQLHAGAARQLPHRRAGRGVLRGDAEQRRRGVRRQQCRQRRRRVDRGRRRPRLRSLAAPHGPAARVSLSQTTLTLRSHRSIAVALVTFATFTDIVAYAIAIPVLPALSRKLGASPTMIGLLFASFGVTLLTVSIPMGAISDRVGRKAPIVGGLVALFAASLLFAFADTLPWLFAARLVQGAADGITWVVGFALVADLYDSNERGRVTGIVMMGTSLAVMIGPTIGGWLYEAGGIRLPFLFVALLSAIGTGLFAWYRPPTRHEHVGSVPVGV